MSSTPRKIPATAGETSAEQPWPVRLLSAKLTDYIARAPGVWVEGQVVQLTRRPGQSTCYLTLRDPDVDLSFNVSTHVRVLDALPTPLQDGSRVVLHARAQLFPRRGSLSLFADQIRPVGVGELLAQLENLRRVLAAEGLFAAARKRPLPFLPTVVGLVCGRASAAERDVVENARRRWPAVRFEIRPVAVQGPKAVEDVVGALRSLDALEEVDVIVVARGGGSVEDLLPFSNEGLLRVVSACRTPIVSAIGHEVDKPLLDLVADWAASTPTDAGKRIVPDVAAELEGVAQLRRRASQSLRTRVAREVESVAALRSRPVMADPHRLLNAQSDLVAVQRERAARALGNRLSHARQDVDHLRQRVRALSPLATMERGYAVVQRADGQVVRSPAEVSAGESLRLRVHAGEIAARVTE
ncbi:exodeoxyribonuclease VII large subunit [Kineosporia rhizophila]|uniref:exodeoxyribonuclease VII large subunit n=1 Tax=Kineosporia rhizophila TaxID=84633 RepID=UPI001E3B3B7E|nr:exodeoxyribonuclease VII large subunit [Kineosporia rhizophila]